MSLIMVTYCWHELCRCNTKVMYQHGLALILHYFKFSSHRRQLRTVLKAMVNRLDADADQYH